MNNQLASAQTLNSLPDLGLILSGNSSRLTIQNNTSRRVIAYALRLEQIQSINEKKAQTVIRSALLAIRNGQLGSEGISIPANGTQTFLPQPTDLTPVTSISLDAALFEDGEFVGPDAGGSYEWITAGVNAQRDLYETLLADKKAGIYGEGTWQKILAVASGQALSTTRQQTSTRLTMSAQKAYLTRQKIFAEELLRVREMQGDEAALTLASKGESYPTIRRSK
jgi:hypothetical protein